MVVDLHKLM